MRAGAPAEILVAAKPHIGTFRLVTVVESLRAEIEALGGEYRFSTRVTDLAIGASGGSRQVEGLVLDDGTTLEATHVVIAPGHSARDLFAMLSARGVHLDAKPFSVGVRIEHPQSVIDRARYGGFAGNPALGAADYKLVHHGTGGRSTYSFCMCPGGTVVAATSEPGRVVTNGMSQYSRAERNANAGIVVGVTDADFAAAPGYEPGPLAGIVFQRHLESLRLRWPAAAATPRRGSAWATSWRGGPARGWARLCPPTSRASPRPISHFAFRASSWPPYARHCPYSAAALPASTWRMR